MIKNYLFVIVLFLAGHLPAHWGATRPIQRLMGGRYLAAYAITIGAGFFAPNVWFYHAVVIGAFLATVTDREDAIIRYVVMIALVPSVTTVIAFGSIFLGQYQSTTSLTVAMLIATVIKPNRGGARPLRGLRTEDLAVAVLYLIFTVGSARFDSVTVLARQMSTTLFDLALPYWLVRRNVRTQEELRRLLGCVALSAMSLAVIALYEARTGWALFEVIQSRLSMTYGLSAFTIRRGNSLRAMASFSTPLIFAYFLMFGLAAWICSRKLFRSEPVWKGGVVVLLLAIFAPQSRGVLIALVPALIVLLVCRRRFAAAAGTLGAAAIGGGALYILQNSSSAIAAFIGNKRAGEFYDYRGLLLHRGMQEGMKHPIFGQSYEATLASLVDITQGDHIVDLVNSYLTMFLLSGIVGFAAFILLSLISFRKLVGRARRGEMIEAVRSNRAFLLSMLTATYIYIYSVSFVERMMIYPVVLFALARLTSTDLVRVGAKRPLVPPVATAADRTRFAERMVPPELGGYSAACSRQRGASSSMPSRRSSSII